MIISSTVIIVSLIYMIFLNLSFFKKERANTDELRIFSKLLVTNVLGLILELSCIFSIKYMDNSSFIVYAINKLYLIYLITFVAIFLLYIYIISMTNKDYYLKMKRGVIVFNVIYSLIIFITPINIMNFDTIIYSSGTGVVLVYIYSTVCILIGTL